MQLQPRRTDPLYDDAGAAAFLGIQSGTLRNWLTAKRIGYVKVGRLTKIPKSELDAYLSARFVPATPRRIA
jgi:excisionase family DNA binding protein